MNDVQKMYLYLCRETHKQITAMMTTVIINTDTPVGKTLLQQVKQHPDVARIVEEQEDGAKNRYSYQEFKKKLATSLNKRFDAEIEP